MTTPVAIYAVVGTMIVGIILVLQGIRGLLDASARIEKLLKQLIDDGVER